MKLRKGRGRHRRGAPGSSVDDITYVYMVFLIKIYLSDMMYFHAAMLEVLNDPQKTKNNNNNKT